MYYQDVSLLFSWRATEGDNALCECCDSDDCFRQTEEENSSHTGHTAQPDTGCSALYRHIQATQSWRLFVPVALNANDSITMVTYVLLTEKKREADTTVGPLHTLPRSRWTGHLSVNN